jgi:hypothetical protein
MPQPSYPGMELLTEHDVARIRGVTRELKIHPDWVVVVLDCARAGKVIMCPDGKILVHAPCRDRFEPWMEELGARLRGLPLGRTPRLEEEDPKRPLTGLHGLRFSGTRNYLHIPDNFEDRKGMENV